MLAERGGRDEPDALVAGDERRRGLDRPVAVRGVDVGVAQTARLDLHAHLPRQEFRHRDPLDGKWATELMDNGGAVGGRWSLRGLGLGGCNGGHGLALL